MNIFLLTAVGTLFEKMLQVSIFVQEMSDNAEICKVMFRSLGEKKFDCIICV